jgi:PiT family inorganic phosphate transporter
VDATLGLPVLVGLIAVALLFDFLNGLHDAANSIATIVSTRVLRPQYAVFWAAFFNFVAFLVFGLNVARTIGTGIVEPSVVDAQVIFAALIGAIVWNLITWGLGIPSSSSHALIGGLVGGGMAKAGISAAVWSGLSKTLVAIVLSPLVGFLLAMMLVAIVSWLSVRSTPYAVDRAFRILQFVSASLYSLGHGGNDAQKTMGIIAVLLYSQGKLGAEFSVPFWVVLACQAAMALGTLMGGWRIVRTMGLRITKLTPMQGVLRRDRGCRDAVHGDLSRGSRLDHAHHHRRHRWRRRSAAGLGGALERRKLDRLCLGNHDSCVGHRRRIGLLGGGADAVESVSADWS